MLSKQTQQLLSSFLRASHVKLPKMILRPVAIQRIQPVFPQLQPSMSLYNFQKSFFANSSNNDDSNSRGPLDPNDPIQKGNKVLEGQSATMAEETKTNEQEPKMEARKLLTVPIKSMKFPLEIGEEKLKQETYVLFNSPSPMIPHSQHPGVVKTGNLGADQINKQKLAYFLQNETGEIYTIGLVLENKANKELKKAITQTISNDPNNASQVENTQNALKANIKEKNYKIKLTEIEVKDNCIIAKGIPYKDSKPTEAEKAIDVQGILVQIKSLILSIKQSVSHEKIDIFNGISFDAIYSKTYDPEKLDKILNNILEEFQKLSNYTKDGLQTFVQAYLEQRSQISRLFMIKKKLEEYKSVLDIVNKSLQSADDQIWKFHEQAKARLSLEYIRNNFFGDSGIGTEKKANVGKTEAQGVPLSGQAQKFMDQLPLIKDEVSRERIRKEIERFSLQDKMSGEYHKLYTYLDEVFSIPWDKTSEEFWDIEYSKQVLEDRLFGLEKVKERIIEMIAVNKLKRANATSEEKKKGFVILLNGPPGVGKTTIAKGIAAALKRESRFISFAGVTDPSFVKGHKRTYLDAQPGVFVKELIKGKTMNPVFILDEVDKLSKHFQGADPYYALMEILNPEENHNFTDHYLDIKVDFSGVVFILTSNQVLNMLEPLRNRLEIIEVPAYIEQEKLIIAKKYLLPAVLNENALPLENMVFDDETLSRIIKGWCYYESGVRELRRCFEKIARKQVLEILNIHKSEHPAILEQPITTTSTSQAETNLSKDEKTTPLKKEKETEQLIELKNQTKLIFNAQIDSEDLLKKYLGNPVFDEVAERKTRRVHTGTANVLTVSGFTGHVMTVECIYDLSGQEKKGILTSSGNLQKVLQESLTIARLVAFKFIPDEKIKEFAEKSVHIHFLQGGTPKDGPSAGVSICSAFLSLMLNKPVPQDISMTGELSLNGDVCKIGGVQAKVTASKSLGINRIILPYGNKNEFFELPTLLKEGLTVYFVKEYQEAYDILFGESAEAVKKIDKYVDQKLTEPIRPMNVPTHTPYVSMKGK